MKKEIMTQGNTLIPGTPNASSHVPLGPRAFKRRREVGELRRVLAMGGWVSGLADLPGVGSILFRRF